MTPRTAYRAAPPGLRDLFCEKWYHLYMANLKNPNVIGVKEIAKSKNLTYIIITILIIFIVGGFSFYHFFIDKYLGLVSCPYTEKIIPVPEALQGSTIKFESDFVLLPDYDEQDMCTLVLSQTKNMIGMDLAGKKWSGNRIASGSEFSIEKIVSSEGYGILPNIDSGPSQISYLILRDKNGVQYMKAIYSLADEHVGYYRNGKRMGNVNELKLLLN